MNKIKKRAIPIVVFTVSALLSCFLVYKNEEQKLEMKRERTRYVTNSQVSKLQYIMDSLFLKTQTLEMLVMEGDGEVKYFDDICKQLLDNKAIRSLQLAPNGVVTFVYPLQGNEEAFGDLFSDPNRKAEAEYARDSGNMTLAGPYELEQGGLGAVARRPIYLPNQSGQSVFWGFSIIILDIPEVFYPAELGQFAKEKFEYKLHRIDPNTKKKQMIDESSKKPLSNPINISFEVPNGIWTFSVMPIKGWIMKSAVVIEVVIAILFSLLLAFLVLAVMRINEQRKKMSELSMKDDLTKLQNQRMLIQTLNNLMDKKMPFELFYLDFDDFKNINDTYGHDCGDLFLIESANRLMGTFEKEASIYRIGGDEFAMLIDQSMSDESRRRIVERVIDVFLKPFEIAGNTLVVTVSIGSAHYPEEAHTLDQIIRIADQSMYRMKNNHKKSQGYNQMLY